MSERSRALKVLQKMIAFIPFNSMGYKQVGYLTKKLNKDDREALQNLKSQDIAKERFPPS